MSELPVLDNVSLQEIIFGNDDRVTICWLLFVCGQKVVGWEIIYHIQGLERPFEVCRGWRVRVT